MGANQEDGQVPTVCLIGATGTGKSATGNTLFKCSTNSHFRVSADPNSTTSESLAKTLPWRGDSSKGNLRCVDTPGLSDTMGRDSDHNQNIVALLKNDVRYVNVFLLLLNAAEPRMREDLQDMLKNFRDSFGQEFISKLMVCYTHWAYDRKAKRIREKDGSTEQHKESQINEQLRAVLGHDFDIPCVFLDNTLNISTMEELEDDYGNQLDAIIAEFERQLDEVYQRAFKSEPFWCGNIKATDSRKDILRKFANNLMHASEHSSSDELGRRLILAEQDVIKKGWLIWKNRKRTYGVLRRQHLRLYTDSNCSEPDCPHHIDLSGCICAERDATFRRGWYFTIYRPLTGQDMEAYSSHEFRVESEMERQRWVLLIAEATQISESCHRIQDLYGKLMAATNESEYVGAVKSIRDKTMVIPVEWVQQCSQSDKVSEMPSLSQAKKDLGRDEVMVEGILFKNPQINDLAMAIAHIVSENTRETEDSQIEAKATILAGDAILSCSRTLGGGDTYSAIDLLFATKPDENKGFTPVHIVPEGKEFDPVKVRVFHEESRVNCSDGMPVFDGDESSSVLSIGKVLKMDLELMRELKVNLVSTNEWVNDKELQQCMRCAVPFNVWLRRHHCRVCGALVCSDCSRHNIPTSSSFASGSLASKLASGYRHSTDSVMAGDMAAGFPETKSVRVCFLCYQKAVVADLNKRKEVGASINSKSDDEESCPSFIEDSDTYGDNYHCSASGKHPVAGDEARTRALTVEEFLSPDNDLRPYTHRSSRSEGTLPTSPDSLDCDVPTGLPAVSVEISSRYKVIGNNLAEDAVLFRLECCYRKVVRWSGLADSGRIFISVVQNKSS